jgi:SulP family sulfate permease
MASTIEPTPTGAVPPPPPPDASADGVAPSPPRGDAGRAERLSRALLVELPATRLGRETLGAATEELRQIGRSPTWAADARAAVVTFLIALPLCLGVAIASGVPPMTGILTGVIGGLLVGLLSQSSLMITAPAAGFVVITVNAIATLGSYRALLASLVVAGGIQMVLGIVGAGTLSYMVPLAVIKGMLAAIGIILVLKQIPHALGYSVDFLGDESFRQLNNETTFSTLATALERVHPGAATITTISLIILIIWARTTVVRRWVPGPLVVVVLAIALNSVLGSWRPGWQLAGTQLVSLPAFGAWAELGRVVQTPDWSVLARGDAWRVALTLGVVASLESLLCLSATNRIDPLRREPSTNRELLAQGVGNAVSGLVGGLPMSGVVVRTAANVDAGAQSKLAAILQALLLLVAVLAAPALLNLIPIPALAAILLYTGWKLAHPSLLQHTWRQGWRRFTPFLVTTVAILVTDLLTGIGIGLIVGFGFVLIDHQRSPGYSVVSPKGAVLTRLRFNDTVTFLHKASLAAKLESMEPGSRIELDGRFSHHIDHDVLELIHEFKDTARGRGIDYRLVGIPDATIMPSH